MKSIKFYKWLINGLVLFMLFSVNAFGAIEGLRGFYYRAGLGNLTLSGLQSINVDPKTTSGYTEYPGKYYSYWPNRKDDNYTDKYYYIDKNIDFGWGYYGQFGVPIAQSDGYNPLGVPYQLATVPSNKPGINGNGWQAKNWSVEWKGYLKVPKTSNLKLYYSYNGKWYIKLNEEKLHGSSALPGALHHWAKAHLLNLAHDYTITNKGYLKFHLKFSPTSADNNFMHLGYNMDLEKGPNGKLLIRPIPPSWFVTEIPTEIFFYDPKTNTRATSFSGIENDGKMDVHIKIDKKPSCAEDVKVDFNITLFPPAINHASASDLNTSSRQITFTCKDSSLIKKIEIPITKDYIAEMTEDFNMTLSNPIIETETYGKNNDTYTFKYANDIKTPWAIGQILSDSNSTQVEFLQPTFYVREGKDRDHPNILRIPIRLNTPTSYPVSVKVTFKDGVGINGAIRGQDYGAQDLVPIVFSSGETVKFVEVEIKDDGIREDIENFYAHLALGDNPNAELGSNDIATIYIIDNKQLNTCYDHSIKSGTDAYTAGWRLIDSTETKKATFTMKKPLKTSCRLITWTDDKCGPDTSSPDEYPSFKSAGDGMAITKKPYFASHPTVKDDKGQPAKRLRISEGSKMAKTGISYNAPFPAAGNFIELEFDYYSYGGCVFPWGNGFRPWGFDAYLNKYTQDHYTDYWSHADSGPGQLNSPNKIYGGAGMAMVLYDAEAGDHPSLGGTDGSLGYAPLDANFLPGYNNDGFEKGWLAVGLDEYGSFTVSNEGRKKGIKQGFEGPEAGASNMSFYSSVTMRGSEPDYRFLSTSGQLIKRGSEKPLSQWAEDFKDLYDVSTNPFFSILPKSNYTKLSTNYSGGKFKLSIDNTDVGKTWIKLERDVGNGYKTIISDFDVQDGYGQKPLPENLRLAFTASSIGREGSRFGVFHACNIRELGDITIKASFCFPENLLNEYRVIEKKYATAAHTWNWKWNSPLRTKVENKNQEYCILAGKGPDNGTGSATVDKNVTLKFVRFIDTTEGSVAQKIGINDDNKLDPHTLGISATYINADNSIKIPKGSTTVCFKTNNEVSTRKGFFLVHDSHKTITTNPEIEYQRSSDYYSIRPKELRMSFYESGTSNVANILYAKKPYDYTFNAVDETNATSANYLQKINAPAKKGSRIYFDSNLTSKVCDVNVSLSAPNDIVFNGGTTGKYPMNANDISFHSAKGEDELWSKIDWEDIEKYKNNKLNAKQEAAFINKIQQYGYECDGISANIPSVTTDFSDKAGGFEECKIPLDKNISFLSHHFDANMTLKGGSDDKAFTYISNYEDMSADIELKIVARAEDNSPLINFDNACYANDLNLSLTLNRDISFDEYNHAINNYRHQLSRSIADNILFWDDSKDLNTTKRLSIKQSNNASFKINKTSFTKGESKAFIHFNFKRDVNEAIEPFYVTARDFNITKLESTEDNITVPEVYKDSYFIKYPASPVDIKSANLSKSIFFYAKASPKPLYSGVSVFRDNYYYQVYCESCISNAVKTRYNMTNWADPLSTLKWYSNDRHNDVKDGNTTSPIPTTPSSTVTAATTITKGVQELTFESNTCPQIVQANATISSWLEYDQFRSNETNSTTFQVEYRCEDNNVGWAGEGGVVNDADGVGETLDTGKTIRYKSKRMEW